MDTCTYATELQVCRCDGSHVLSAVRSVEPYRSEAGTHVSVALDSHGAQQSLRMKTGNMSKLRHNELLNSSSWLHGKNQFQTGADVSEEPKSRVGKISAGFYEHFLRIVALVNDVIGRLSERVIVDGWIRKWIQSRYWQCDELIERKSCWCWYTRASVTHKTKMLSKF